jgi:integron integrase
MLTIPSFLQTQFQEYLRNRTIPNTIQAAYLKWLRYDLDFCQKYHFPPEYKESLPHFLKKLQEKRQTQAQQEQAAQAVTLYYELLESRSSVPTPGPSQEGNLTTAPSQEGKSTPGPLRQPSDSQEEKPTSPPVPTPAGSAVSITSRQDAPAEARVQANAVSRPTRTGLGVSWKAEYPRLAEILQHRQYDQKTANAYTQWVRKFQAFTRSKPPADLSPEDARAFLISLTTKHRMTVSKQNQVFDALLVWYRHVLNKDFAVGRPARPEGLKPSLRPTPEKGLKPSLQTDGLKPSGHTGASWQAEYTALTNAIKMRHYSPRTLKTYTQWVRKLQAFTRSKPPESLSPEDVKAFLTFLAVERQVSASSQNQAFNALLFFFRHVLKQEFGEMEGVVRAKRKPYIPVVLSRAEIDAIVQHLVPPYDLVVKLLYGCGLRLSECLNLRVHCLNFDAGVLTVHDGKGQKDRTVPLPQTILSELRTQLEAVKDLHQRDLKRKYAGVFLPHALEKKYKQAARELIWQWVFPAIELTCVPGTKEYRRSHLHESHVQKAIKAAVGKARIYKRASAHTFRPFDKLRTGSVLPVTCFRRIMISGQFRSYWGIAI